MMRFKACFRVWAVTSGLVLAASAANAQTLAPNNAAGPSYQSVSDIDGPYEGMPPAPPPPAYNYGGGYDRQLLPPQEVYAVLRDNGFSPLGVPHQRGFVYFIAVVDRRGDDGRLVIDARNGRILRFVPSYGYGPGPYGGYSPPEPMPGYGPETSLPPPTVIRGIPRPPGSIPHVASRTAPVPLARPAAAGSQPAPAQQSAAIETKQQTAPPAQAGTQTGAQTGTQPNTAQAAPQGGAPVSSTQAAAGGAPPATTVGEAKRGAVILPTQAMPKAQGLD
jgi:hypothetical protein